MKNFVLCRPENGLNDILNQVELCCRYAEDHGRIVVIDTAFRNSFHFKDQFSKYFTSRHEFLLLENPFTDEVLDSLDVFPHFLKGRASSYRPRLNFQFTDEMTGKRISFDFRLPYEETVLVHHNGHGGLQSLNALKRLVLAPALARMLEERIIKIGQSFAAIHIRHTDVTTDYTPVIAGVKKRQLPTLFVATDNRRVVEDFRAALRETRIISFSSLPVAAGKTLHINPPKEEAEVRNRDAILDLLTLALAKPLLLAQTQNTYQNKYSGYSRLAAALNQSPAILRSVLSSSPMLADRVARSAKG